jgi:hypothetical protein
MANTRDYILDKNFINNKMEEKKCLVGSSTNKMMRLESYASQKIILTFDFLTATSIPTLIGVMDRPKGSLAHLLRSNTIQSPNSTFGYFTCDTPLLREGGVHGASDTGSNEPQRLSARSRNKLTWCVS